jgi:REP element-mobilizing transposase RayT
MAQSLSRVLVHIIFSTKERFPFLVDIELRKRIHAYLAQVFNGHDSPAIEVGGTEDHVHILCLLSRNHAISEIIKKAKANSSGWVKTQQGLLSKFEWQGGYGAFSIHQSQIDQVTKYIRGQVEHHRRRTFQEEYLDFLREYQIPYDERYLWR